MKYSVLLLLVVFLTACGGEDKEETTPESSEKEAVDKADNPLRYDAILLDLFDQPAKSNTFRIGERMNLTIQNVRGLLAKNGQYNVGMSLKATDDAGNVVTSVDDIFEVEPVKFPVNEDVNITYYVDYFAPFKANTNYTIEMNLWDKNGEQNVLIKQPVKVLPATVNGFIDLDEKGIAVDRIICYRSGRTYSGNTFYPGEIIMLNIGLDESFLSANPAIKTESNVYNAEGEVLFNSKESATLSADTPPFNNSLLLLKDKYVPGTYKVVQTIEAPKTGASLVISYEFEVAEEPAA